MPAIIPLPASIALRDETFQLGPACRVVAGAELADVAERFAASLRRATGWTVDVSAGAAIQGDIAMAVDAAACGPSPESYHLTVGDDGVLLLGSTPAGVYRGLTTLRQLLPTEFESAARRDDPWAIAGADIDDTPRFEYRGVMLDVARHFFPPEEIVRLLDLLALLKINVLHLHLTDDQGWRLTVPGWAQLTEVGGRGDIDGGPGGWFSEADLIALVDAAAERFITIVPEVDLPGHTTAALIAHPELAADGERPEPFHRSGISRATVAVGTEDTERFLDDVIAALTTQVQGPYVHLGGDEAEGTDPADFDAFVPAAAAIAVKAGRQPIVWHEGARTDLPPETIVHYWGTPAHPHAIELALQAVAAGHRLILSPADHVYVDMRYDDMTPFGLTWAGFVTVQRSYAWDPATVLDGIAEDDVLGVEAALWTETVATRDALDLMMFPRIASLAEIGWSAPEGRSWEEYRERLAQLGRRWDALGVGYFRCAEVDWT